MPLKTVNTSGRGMRIRLSVSHCSLGKILVAQSEKGICAILLGDSTTDVRMELKRLFPRARLTRKYPVPAEVLTKVVEFVESPRKGFDLPLDIRGTTFQKRVWEALCTIQPGKTLTYAEVAQLIGAPKAVRAVARACAANTLGVAIPCHRVVCSDGSLSGYRWGDRRKRWLLAMETGTVISHYKFSANDNSFMSRLKTEMFGNMDN